MSMISLRGATRLTLVGLLVCGSPLVLNNLALERAFDRAQAQESGPLLPSQTVTAEARSFEMPLGVFSPDTLKVNQEAPRPGIPMSDDELAQIKQGVGYAPTAVRSAPIQAREQGKQPLSVTTNCATNSATGSAPSDIHGAVGTTNIVVVTNVDIGVYNKSTCSSVSFMSQIGRAHV